MYDEKFISISPILLLLNCNILCNSTHLSIYLYSYFRSMWKFLFSVCVLLPVFSKSRKDEENHVIGSESGLKQSVEPITSRGRLGTISKPIASLGFVIFCNLLYQWFVYKKFSYSTNFSFSFFFIFQCINIIYLISR